MSAHNTATIVRCGQTFMLFMIAKPPQTSSVLSVHPYHRSYLSLFGPHVVCCLPSAVCRPPSAVCPLLFAHCPLCFRNTCAPLLSEYRATTLGHFRRDLNSIWEGT